VKREYRDAIVSKIEEQMIAVGSKSFDDGMRTISKLLEVLKKNIDQMRTKEQLEQMLDSLPDPSRTDFYLVLGTFKFFPHLIRFGLRSLSEKLDEDLPRIPRGRPGLDLVTKQRIIAHIGKRHMSGYTLEQAKKSTAIQFKLSESTIQRAWDGRNDIGDVDFRSVVRFLEEDVAS
jgi:hypothetical protein